jgi:hypothetical protein
MPLTISAVTSIVRFFVVVNSIVAAYLVLSIPLSIVHIIRSRAKYSRLVLLFFDTVSYRLLETCSSFCIASSPVTTECSFTTEFWHSW